MNPKDNQKYRDRFHQKVREIPTQDLKPPYLEQFENRRIAIAPHAYDPPAPVTSSSPSFATPLRSNAFANHRAWPSMATQ